MFVSINTRHIYISLFCFLKPDLDVKSLTESVSQRREEDSSQQMFSCPVVNMKTLATTTEIREGMELSAKSHDSPTGFAHPCASRPQRVPVKNSDHKLTVATGFHVGYVPSLLLIWKIISWQLWIWNIVAFTHKCVFLFCFILFCFLLWVNKKEDAAMECRHSKEECQVYSGKKKKKIKLMTDILKEETLRHK